MSHGIDIFSASMRSIFERSLFGSSNKETQKTVRDILNHQHPFSDFTASDHIIKGWLNVTCPRCSRKWLLTEKDQDALKAALRSVT